MSFIHYKLITNKNYEKVTFDGVSLSVGELKKLILEKKFRKHTGPPGSAATGTAQAKKSSEVDLEVRCVDTDQIYQKDSDLIPKNSRVQINRVVRNPGPAIAGGTITSTHKENELLADIRMKQQKLQELTSAKKSDDLPEDLTKQLSIKTNFSLTSSPSSMTASPNELTPNQYKSSPQISQRTSIYDNIEDNSSNSSSQIEHTKTVAPSLPPLELLCPFEDTEKNERHLMKNAVIAPCCGYFICCEECVRDRLRDKAIVECPRDDCLQEITIHHRLTPYNPMRQKIKDFLIASSLLQETKFPSSLFAKKNLGTTTTAASNDTSIKGLVEKPKAQTQTKSNIQVKYKKLIVPNETTAVSLVNESKSIAIAVKIPQIEIQNTTPPTTTSLPNLANEKSRSSISPVSSKSDITSPCDRDKARSTSQRRRSGSNLSRVSSSDSGSGRRSRNSHSRSRSRSSSRSYLSKVSSNEIRLKSSRSNSFSSSTSRRSRSRTRSKSPKEKSKRDLLIPHTHSSNVTSQSLTSHAQSYYFNNNNGNNIGGGQSYFGNQPPSNATQIPQASFHAPPPPPFLTNSSAHFQTPNNSYQQLNQLQHGQQPVMFNQNGILPSVQQQYPQHLYNGQMVNYPQPQQQIPYNQMMNGQQFNSNMIYQFEMQAAPSMLNGAYPSNQMYPTQWNQTQTLTPITNQLQFKSHNRLDSYLPSKRSYTKSRSRTPISRSRSRSRSRSYSRSPLTSSSKNRSKKRSRSRTRSRSRSRSVNRSSKRVYNRDRSPRHQHNSKHIRSDKGRDRKTSPSYSSHRSNKNYRDRHSSPLSRKSNSNRNFSSFNERNGKNRDKLRRSRERSRSRSRERDQKKFASYTRNGDHRRATEKNPSNQISTALTNDSNSQLTPKKIETKAKENETILIKDTITKRVDEDDEELEEGEEKWDDDFDVKQNDLVIKRNNNNNNNNYNRSFWSNNNKTDIKRSGSFKAPCIQITLPNIVSDSKAKISETDKSGESSNTSKNRFVFLFKGDYSTEKTTSSNKINYRKPINTSDNEVVISDDDIDIKTNGDENGTPVKGTADNTTNYYCVPSVKKTANTNLNSPQLTRTNSVNKIKKPNRRVHLAHEIASPVFKASLLSRLSMGTQSQQIVPSAPLSVSQPDEQNKPVKIIEIKTNVQTPKPLERNQSFQDENDFLDISIGDKDQL